MPGRADWGGANLEMFNSDHVPTSSERAFSGCILDTSAGDGRIDELCAWLCVCLICSGKMMMLGLLGINFIL